MGKPNVSNDTDSISWRLPSSRISKARKINNADTCGILHIQNANYPANAVTGWYANAIPDVKSKSDASLQ